MSYVSNLTAAWRSRYQSESQQSPSSVMAESLSAREGDILRLIAEGRSNKEIARNLAITPTYSRFPEKKVGGPGTQLQARQF
jgi:DNA-binding CsgD family transcriptional regulator